MLHEILKNTAARYPEKSAIVYANTSYTYEQLTQLSEKCACAFLELGVRKGDRVGFLLFNCPEMVICYFACFKIGAVAVPISFRLKADEVDYRINHSKPKVLITEQRLYSLVRSIKDDIPSVHNIYLIDCDARNQHDVQAFSELLTVEPDRIVFPAVHSQTPAVILYTSGTTGKPKGTVLTNGQLNIHTLNHAHLVHFKSQDKTLVCLGLCSNFALSHQLLCGIYSGATLDIIPHFDPQKALDVIRFHDVTMLYMMPVMYNELVKLAKKLGCPISSKLRLAVVAGDSTPSVVFRDFKKCFSLDICEGIGMTETQIYALNPLYGKKKIGSVGCPVDYMEVEVQDKHGNSLPPGHTGEITVKGKIVFENYLDNLQATADSFRNEWFLTGDLGSLDDDGYLWFKGRRKQLIVHDGINISPQEVEEVFYHHPAVSEVAVVGVPDAIEGENIKAYVALHVGTELVTEIDLLAFAKKHLADYKLPQSIEFRDSLPKVATGKLDRRRLRVEAIRETQQELPESEV